MSGIDDAPLNGAMSGAMLDDFSDEPENWPSTETFEVDNEELAGAAQAEQVELMRQWFLARFQDPAQETPYESAEGGYIWIWGGPYEPREELETRFGGVASDEAIEELVEELYAEVGWQWAPVRRDDEDRYDEQFEVDVDSPSAPLATLKSRLEQVLSVLPLRGDPYAVEQLPKMAFGAAISALEAYLWESMVYWTKSDRAVIKGIVANMPELRDQSIKLGDIFAQYEAIEGRVMLYLQHMVWHRWDKVAQLFLHGLDVRPPSFKPFKEALAKRHDIVHRSGHDIEGNLVSISEDDVRALASDIESFGQELHDRIVDKIAPPDAGANDEF